MRNLPWSTSAAVLGCAVLAGAALSTAASGHAEAADTPVDQVQTINAQSSRGEILIAATTAAVAPLDLQAGNNRLASAAPDAVATILPAAPAPIANANSGPSPWTGPVLRRPRGTKFPRKITRWANITLAVMAEHRIPPKFLPGILAQIEQESDGDPRSTNLTDSNAAAGDPSKGLLQVIGDTYQTHAKRGYRSLKFQARPYTNIWAALAYVKANYGMSKFQKWNDGINSAY